MTGRVLAGSMDRGHQSNPLRRADGAGCGSGANLGRDGRGVVLISDRGGGHRRAGEAVIAALAANYGTSIRPVLCDPLSGPDAPSILRWLARLYGPAIRWAPLAWGAAYYATN